MSGNDHFCITIVISLQNYYNDDVSFVGGLRKTNMFFLTFGEQDLLARASLQHRSTVIMLFCHTFYLHQKINSSNSPNFISFKSCITFLNICSQEE